LFDEIHKTGKSGSILWDVVSLFVTKSIFHIKLNVIFLFNWMMG
jgi:hypothetical protein